MWDTKARGIHDGVEGQQLPARPGVASEDDVSLMAKTAALGSAAMRAREDRVQTHNASA
jgi:hypothetical protein